MFLFDGLGAGVSLGMTAAILWLEPWFGMPSAIVQILVPLTAVFMGYSLLSWHRKPQRWRLALGVIAVANLAYAVMILALLAVHRETVTTLGFAYFGGEAMVLLALGSLEIRTARRR